MSRRRLDNRGLTAEEEALWRKAMRDVAPYGRRKPSVEKIVSGAHHDAVEPSKPASRLLKPRQTAGSKPVRHAEALAPRRQHPFVSGDPRLDKLAGRGRLAIDGVLDLHGHSQRTAEAALKRFVTARHAEGARCLLVITGKGAPDMAPSRGLDGPGGRGVLRARLSDWLAEPPLRGLVSRAAPAHPRHGGGGAFYLFLKR